MSDSPIALSDAMVGEVCDMASCVQVLDGIYREMAAGTAVNGPRVDLVAPRADVLVGDRWVPSYRQLKTMSAVTSRYGCVRVLSDAIVWPLVDGVLRKAFANPPRGSAVTRGSLLLFDVESGDLLALMSEGLIRNLRVGASAGLAARLLARRDADRIGVLGSGSMARANLEGVAHARPPQAVRVYSPSMERREAFAREMSAKLSTPVSAVESPEEAVKGASIVITATNSIAPVVSPGWLTPGMHLTCVRHLELQEILDRCQLVVLNSKAEAAPLWRAAQSSAGTPVPEFVRDTYSRGYPSDDDRSRLPDLVDLYRSKEPARRTEDDITCFDNSIGWGLQFLAVAVHVLEHARANGLGDPIPHRFLPGFLS